jgi:hypothetical protein
MMDPSGNVPICSGGGADWYEGDNCSGVQTNYTKKTIIRQLQRDYKWSVQGDWTLEQLQLFNYTGSVIENRIDTITGGYGKEWMSDNLSWANFKHPGPVLGFVLGDNDYVTGWSVNLHDNFGNGLTINYWVGHLSHELAHVWENHAALGSVYMGGGVGDQLTRYVGGEPRGLRFINGTSGIPPDHQWTSRLDAFPDYPSYGNHSTADYVANGFQYLIMDPAKISTDNVIGTGIMYDVIFWLESEILREARH